MAKPAPHDIAELIQAVQASQKYAAIGEEVIESIGRRELATRRNLKEAIKATKNKLHQIAGAYIETRLPYDEWLALLANVPTFERSNVRTLPALKQACVEIMRHHASTRERLPILESFYTTTLGSLGPLRSVLDLACGLNPLALPWMPLAPDARYYACDIYADMMAFLNGFFALAGVRGQARVCDLVAHRPAEQVDLALVLKALPPLDQQARNAGRDLLRALNARHILVSFPVHSLGGRGKGMTENYELRFRALADAEEWSVERFVFPTELAFLVTKVGDRG
ncbi:MAG TPA: 16S rRNA methyltransferase [Roseiflexaceae bacterium]|nr:16S rRNA methyltransferase [Roseiflexaceae bacterium]